MDKLNAYLTSDEFMEIVNSCSDNQLSLESAKSTKKFYKEKLTDLFLEMFPRITTILKSKKEKTITPEEVVELENFNKTVTRYYKYLSKIGIKKNFDILKYAEDTIANLYVLLSLSKILDKDLHESITDIAKEFNLELLTNENPDENKHFLLTDNIADNIDVENDFKNLINSFSNISEFEDDAVTQINNTFENSLSSIAVYDKDTNPEGLKLADFVEIVKNAHKYNKLLSEAKVDSAHNSIEANEKKIETAISRKENIIVALGKLKKTKENTR